MKHSLFYQENNDDVVVVKCVYIVWVGIPYIWLSFIFRQFCLSVHSAVSYVMYYVTFMSTMCLLCTSFVVTASITHWRKTPLTFLGDFLTKILYFSKKSWTLFSTAAKPLKLLLCALVHKFFWFESRPNLGRVSLWPKLVQPTSTSIFVFVNVSVK